jgi:hypothetical protein
MVDGSRACPALARRLVRGAIGSRETDASLQTGFLPTRRETPYRRAGGTPFTGFDPVTESRPRSSELGLAYWMPSNRYRRM